MLPAAEWAIRDKFNIRHGRKGKNDDFSAKFNLFAYFAAMGVQEPNR